MEIPIEIVVAAETNDVEVQISDQSSSMSVSDSEDS